MERFFISGYNKSGTTFLQMLLDAHQAINCPSEHHFLTLLSELSTLSLKYEKLIQSFDERTANQGLRFNRDIFVSDLVRQSLLSLMSFGVTTRTTHSGLNDNSILENGDFFAALMPEAKFVFIVRDPRDVGISLWHHKMRTEPAFAQSKSPLAKTVTAVGKAWSAHIRKLLAFEEAQPWRVMVLRYEDLIAEERDAALEAALDFLGVDYGQQDLSAMWEAVDFDRLKTKELASTGAKTGFFRTGKSGTWREVLDDDLKTMIVTIAAAELERFDYPRGA